MLDGHADTNTGAMGLPAKAGALVRTLHENCKKAPPGGCPPPGGL